MRRKNLDNRMLNMITRAKRINRMLNLGSRARAKSPFSSLTDMSDMSVLPFLYQSFAKSLLYRYPTCRECPFYFPFAKTLPNLDFARILPT
jgi:hypothetical protein